MPNQIEKKVEFDFLAKDYHQAYIKSLGIFSRNPTYFAQYKIRDLFNLTQRKNIPTKKILDFGCGIGRSIPFFEQYFPKSALSFVDTSIQSLHIAKLSSFKKHSFELIDKTIALESKSQDIVFSAGVFHHIPPLDRSYWLSEIYRVTRPGGLLCIFEHNPFNPITFGIVQFSTLDANAKLISANALKKIVLSNGWTCAKIDYKVFLPLWFSWKKLEDQLSWCPLGAQYQLIALKQK